MATTPKEDSPAPLNFEDALAALETIVQELEEGRISLAEALARYEQGVQLLRQCYQQLAEVERRIELLSRVDSEGRAHCEPYDDDAISLDEKAQSRARRRSREANSQSSSPPDEMDDSPRLF